MRADQRQNVISMPLTDVPIETLHSQLYLLHVLNLCLSASWQDQSEISPPPSSDLPQCWPDPYAFDDNLARYLLSAIMVYSRMLSSDSAVGASMTSSTPSQPGKGPAASSKTREPHWTKSYATRSFGRKFIRDHSYPSVSSPVTSAAKPRLVATLCSTRDRAINHMIKLVSRTVFHLSASNWPMILSRIKSRISYLTTTIEEDPDLVELRLLEWANLDRMRLEQVMQEVSTFFPQIKRPAQITVASVLRKAIWNWMDVYPEEYELLVESNRKIEGGADVLFDSLHSLVDLSSSSNTRRVRTFYPLMAMLLVLCPDNFKRAISGGSNTTRRDDARLSKMSSFLQSLRKGLAVARSSEACAVCLVDFMRAAMCVSPRLRSSAARTLISDIENDLRVSLAVQDASPLTIAKERIVLLATFV